MTGDLPNPNENRPQTASDNGSSAPIKKAPDKSMIFMGMGIEAVVAVLGGFWIGLQLDGYLGKKGIGPAVGSILMLVGWFVHLLQVMKKYDEEP